MNQTPKEVLETILGQLGFFVEIEEELREGHLILQIRTNEPQRLIGRRDETLESLQFLINRSLLSQNNEAPRVVDLEPGQGREIEERREARRKGPARHRQDP